MVWLWNIIYFLFFRPRRLEWAKVWREIHQGKSKCTARATKVVQVLWCRGCSSSLVLGFSEAVKVLGRNLDLFLAGNGIRLRKGSEKVLRGVPETVFHMVSQYVAILCANRCCFKKVCGRFRQLYSTFVFHMAVASYKFFGGFRQPCFTFMYQASSGQICVKCCCCWGILWVVFFKPWKIPI